MLTRMRETPKSDGGEGARAGLLAELPRARPQRASARRASAGKVGTGKAAVHPPASKRRSPKTDRGGARAGQRSGAKANRRSSSKADPHSAAAKERTGAVAGSTILAGLPRVRPQSASPRRAAARAARSRGSAHPTEQPVPRQGFESDPERMNGPVQPPGGAELAASLGELAGELAKVGVATGARLLKDVLSRLPG